jgi:Gpi18-like mannosyltransferase
MKKSEYMFVIKSFLVWRLVLFAILFFAIKFIPLQQHFLGGGMQNYLSNPYLWAWGNFDGEHYLSIAQLGYQPLTYFFFPFYPLVIKILGGTQLVALIISNLSFLGALIGLYKLVRIDFSQKIANLTIVLLLIFPTSFYFGSVYTESIFLALVVWGFYFLRKSNFLLSALLIAISGATRIIGMVAAASFLPEYIKKRRWEILILPLGIAVYMLYQYKSIGDPLNFLNTVGIFGEQRSSGVVFLPQVFYRYIFKIVPNLNYSVFTSYYPAILELVTAAIFSILSVYSFFKLRLEYSLFLAFGIILSTLPGSFSSLPRYVLVLFPAFIIASSLIERRSVFVKTVIFGILSGGLVASTALFVRGFWIA